MTIVAACTSAETGVGPAMASGSHTNSGPWADLPAAPKSSSTGIQVWTASPEPPGPVPASSPRALASTPPSPCSENVPYCW